MCHCLAGAACILDIECLEIVVWVQVTGRQHAGYLVGFASQAYYQNGSEIGVQRVSPGAAAVAIMPLEDSQERYYLALALPEVHAMKQPATLITSRGIFKSGRILYLDNSYRTRQIKAVKLVELSGAFERFQYETIEA